MAKVNPVFVNETCHGMQVVDFGRTFGLGRPVVAYARTQLTAAHGQTIKAQIEHNDGCKIWLNGGRVYEKVGDRNIRLVFAERSIEMTGEVTLELRAGVNTLLVKSETRGEEWRFHIQPPSLKGAVVPRSGEPVKIGLSCVENVDSKIAELTNWLVVGPFENSRRDLAAPHAPEQEIVFGKMYPGRDGLVTWTIPKLEVLGGIIGWQPWGSLYHWAYYNGGTAWAMQTLAETTGEEKYRDYASRFCDYDLEGLPSVEFYYYAQGRSFSGHGFEDAGDRHADDALDSCNTGVYKDYHYQCIGMNELSRPFYNLEYAQFAELVPQTGVGAYSWPEYQSRSVMLVGTEYIVIYDAILEPCGTRFAWNSAGAQDELPGKANVGLSASDPDLGVSLAYTKPTELTGSCFGRQGGSLTLKAPGMGKFHVDGGWLPANADGTFKLPPGQHHWEFTSDLPEPMPPIILRTENYRGGAKVIFTTMTGAEKNRLELSRDNGAAWQRVGETTQVEYELTSLANGSKVHVMVYEYAVAAVNGNGEGAKSVTANTDPASWCNWNPAADLRFKRQTAFWLPPYVGSKDVPPLHYETP